MWTAARACLGGAVDSLIACCVVKHERWKCVALRGIDDPLLGVRREKMAVMMEMVRCVTTGVILRWFRSLPMTSCLFSSRISLSRRVPFLRSIFLLFPVLFFYSPSSSLM